MNAPAPTYTRYRVAAIQYEPSLGEKEKNITDLLQLVEEAAQHNARLIVLPEMATTGYCWESRAELLPLSNQSPAQLPIVFNNLHHNTTVISPLASLKSIHNRCLLQLSGLDWPHMA